MPMRGHDAVVTTDRFADRLDPATYADDDGVVGVFEADPSEADALWFSDRLFRRLVLIATAYELHTLPLLEGVDPVRLNRAMCESLSDELAFVANRVDDAPTIETAQYLSDYISARLRRHSWDGAITVEPD